MIPKSEKNSDEYQYFIIDKVSWYPYFSTILGVAVVTIILVAILTAEIKWLIILPAMLAALYIGQHNVEKKWHNYVSEIKKAEFTVDDKDEYWKCSCGNLNPIGTICECGKSAVNNFKIK